MPKISKRGLMFSSLTSLLTPFCILEPRGVVHYIRHFIPSVSTTLTIEVFQKANIPAKKHLIFYISMKESIILEFNCNSPGKVAQSCFIPHSCRHADGALFLTRATIIRDSFNK